MKKIIGLIFILIMLCPMSLAETFNDVSGSWAEEYIEKAVENGLFSGYPDGSFKPEKNISRIEYITVVNKVLSIYTLLPEADYSKVYVYPDVKEVTWAENTYNQFMTRVNLYGSVADNYYGAEEMQKIFGEKFEPYKSITREEAVAIISLFIKDEVRVDLEDKFNDIGSATFPESIKVSNKIGIISGYPDGTFRPFKNITRAEASVILLNFNNVSAYMKDVKRSVPVDKYNEYLEPIDVLKKIIRYESLGEFYNSFGYYKSSIALSYEKYMANSLVRAYTDQSAKLDTFEFSLEKLSETEAIVHYHSSLSEYQFSKKFYKINDKWYADFSTDISL